MSINIYKKCKVSRWKNNLLITKFLFFVLDFVIQQSTGASTTEFSSDKLDFIKKLGLNAKENMSFASFSNETQ